MRKTVVVVNPRSAAGSLGRRWHEVERVLATELGPFETRKTRSRRDATRLTREAIAGGADLVIAVGGDGTIHEVANGFFDDDGRPAAGGAAMGIVPFGTGGDFRKTAGIPRDLARSAAILAARKTRAIDVGMLEYRRPSGEAGRSAFVNSASLGMAGLVDVYVDGSSKLLGGKIAFFIATLRAALRYRNQRVRLVFDGKEDEAAETSVINVAVANGRYFGGGMQVAPDARLDDGVFDVITIGDMGLVEMTLSLPRLYKGTHVALPKVDVRRATRVEARPVNGAEVLLDVDGEQLGVLPATFTLVPRALPLVVPADG